MPLIKEIADLKEFSAPINAGVDFDTFLPSCKHIEKKVIRPAIGADLYDTLLEAYELSIAQIPTEMPEALKNLLPEVRAVLAPLATLHYKHSVIAGISDAGMVEKSIEQAAPVRLWVNSLQSETLFTEGMDALDMLLEFLEENKGDYQDWVQSDAYTEFHELLMQTTKEFDNEVKIGESRRLFKALRPDIKYAELQVVRKNIGAAFYNRLLTARKDDSFTQDELEVIPMIHAVTANFAIAHSSLPIELGADGMFTLFTDSQFSGYKSSKRPPAPSELERLRANYHKRGLMYLEDLLEHLNKNASVSVFPEYFASVNYTAPATNDDTSINDGLDKIFVA